MKIFRTIIAGSLLLMAAHSVEESYESGILGDFVHPWTDQSYRLIGLGCGEQKETVLGDEEDEFPICESITPLARRI